MVKLMGAVLQLLSVNVPKIVLKLKLNAYVYCCLIHLAQIASEGQYLCQCSPTDKRSAFFLETCEV